MTNKELKKKIGEYRTTTMSIYSDEPPMLLRCLTDNELMDLIKEVVTDLIPNDEYLQACAEVGNETAVKIITDMKDNLEKLLKE